MGKRGRDNGSDYQEDDTKRRGGWADEEPARASAQEFDPDAPTHDVLVRGVADGTRTRDIKNLFDDVGKVKLLPAKKGGLMAIVSFKTKEQAEAACEGNCELFGESLLVSMPRKGMGKRGKPIRAPSVPVVIEKLPEGTEEKELRKVMTQFGAVANITLEARHATVEFVTSIGANKAVETPVRLSNGTKIRPKLQDAETVVRPTLITVHVSKLLKNAKESEVRAGFEDCGTIRGVRMAHPASGPCAFVDFETKTAARKACKKKKLKIGGAMVKIAMSTSQATAPSEDSASRYMVPQGATRTVIVKNLSFDLNPETDIKRHFKKCGKVMAIRPFNDHDTGKFKGMAYIDFEETDGAEAAVALNGMDIVGRPVKVDYAVSKTEALKAKEKFHGGKW